MLPTDNEVGTSGTTFNPEFPVGNPLQQSVIDTNLSSNQATCPFVTAVGATQINPGNTVNDPEGACEQVIFSGGGFSNIFALVSFFVHIEWYQTKIK